MSKAHLYEIIDELSLTHHLENTPLGIIVWDERNEIIHWSDRASEIFGWTPEETLHQQIASLNMIHEEDAATVARILEEIKSGRVLRNQSANRNITKSGKVIYCEWYNSALVDDEGHITSILSMVQDVTDKKKAAVALEKSQQQLSLIYNSAIDPMWLIGVEEENQFRFEDINTAFTLVTGLSRENVVGKLVEEVLPVSSHAIVRTKYREAIETGKVIDYIEVAVHPAGQKVGEIRVIPVKDNQGKVKKLLGIANDITEKRTLQKQLDVERDEFNRRVTAAAIKGQEIERSKVSRELHDNVNQVLTTVRLYTELCASGAANVPELLARCSQLLDQAINEIRDLSQQLSAPSLGDIGLIETLGELTSSIQVTRKLRITLDTSAVSCNQIDSELHLAVYRIAQEHLTNILKHAEASDVFIELGISHDRLELTIRDNGKGFDPNLPREGIGITNMITRAETLFGTVSFTSAPGQGTTMAASFPVLIKEGKCLPGES